MTSASQVRRADMADAEILAQVIADAFHHLELCTWLVPDPVHRRRILPPHFYLFIDHALSYGTVETTRDRAAVAVWFPAMKIPDINGYDTRLAAICDPYTDRFRALDAAVAAAGPPDSSRHEHLAFLAVRPDRQGMGLGSILLAHRHRLLDRRGIPAYLEASNRYSRGLYLRHGYQPCRTPFGVPGGPDPVMWPMLRLPVRPN
jgi:GNAT superfamily N-acetyltransferase